MVTEPVALAGLNNAGRGFDQLRQNNNRERLARKEKEKLIGLAAAMLLAALLASAPAGAAQYLVDSVFDGPGAIPGDGISRSKGLRCTLQPQFRRRMPTLTMTRS